MFLLRFCFKFQPNSFVKKQLSQVKKNGGPYQSGDFKKKQKRWEKQKKRNQAETFLVSEVTTWITWYLKDGIQGIDSESCKPKQWGHVEGGTEQPDP